MPQGQLELDPGRLSHTSLWSLIYNQTTHNPGRSPWLNQPNRCLSRCLSKCPVGLTLLHNRLLPSLVLRSHRPARTSVIRDNNHKCHFHRARSPTRHRHSRPRHTRTLHRSPKVQSSARLPRQPHLHMLPYNPLPLPRPLPPTPLRLRRRPRQHKRTLNKHSSSSADQLTRMETRLRSPRSPILIRATRLLQP